MDEGPCKSIQPMFYFDIDTQKCEPFDYGGCQGNENKFNTLADCEEMCLVERGKDPCQLEEDPGPCRSIIIRYFFSTISQKYTTHMSSVYTEVLQYSKQPASVSGLSSYSIRSDMPVLLSFKPGGRHFYVKVYKIPGNSETRNFRVLDPAEQNEAAAVKQSSSRIDCRRIYRVNLRVSTFCPLCNRTWDGWLCWDDTPAGMTSVQRCPDYFQDFDPSEKVTKICDENGNWFSHPESNRTWTNYTRCTANTPQKVKTALNQYYLTIIGHGLSIASLLISLGIFFYFKILFGIFYIATSFIHFCCLFAEKQHLMWYYLLGWGFPLIPASIHAIARSLYYNDNCWISSETHLLYIIHGPICTALLVNLFFLLNIVRVLITKLKVTHQAESSLYMKAVRATLILVPLLGIQFVLFPWKPQGRVAEELYDYVMNILMHYQGLLVATIFCFFNGEVQAVLRRHWNQYRIQFGNSFSHTDTLRSASYTVSSITDVQGSMYSNDCHSEHLNGKGSHDIDTITLKSENTYA
ncbi:UNVERIFIED_CONTAM: hypothetical protein FKN15_066234 [Acipenser sinensis]